MNQIDPIDSGVFLNNTKKNDNISDRHFFCSYNVATEIRVVS